MNGFDLLDAMNGADERFINEAFDPAWKRRSRIRKRKTIVIAAAAVAALAMSVTGGAAAYKAFVHRDSVEYYYNEKMASDIERYGFAVGQVTENDHLRMTLESLMVDENFASGIVTVEYLDDAGRTAMENSNKWLIMLDSNGNNIFHYTIGDDIPGPFFGHGMIENGSSDRKAYTLELPLHDPYSDTRSWSSDTVSVVFAEEKDIPLSPDEIFTAADIPSSVFDGICLTINTEPNTDSVRLTADSGHKAVISQFAYDFQYDNAGVPFLERGFPDEMTLCFKDGTRKALHFNREYNREGDFIPEWGGGRTRSDHDDDNEDNVHGLFNSILDISGLESVEYAGEIYNVIETGEGKASEKSLRI
ncbi:MAG: hypothetical protein IKN17_09080 [Ruminococcus sp.]|nr:hypothetical protein [Ruminococcus sp.]